MESNNNRFLTLANAGDWPTIWGTFTPEELILLVNVADEIKGETALHAAVRQHNILAILQLLKYEANPNAKNYDDNSPLDIAELQSDDELMRTFELGKSI
jgi:ankyrin repeat protein